MDVKRFLLAGVLGGFAVFIVWLTAGIMVQILRLYDVLSLGGMRGKDDPIMLLFFLHPWVISFAMATVYSQVGRAAAADTIRAGVKFGLLMWLVLNVPLTYIVYTSMDYPPAFALVSMVTSFVYMPLAGTVIAKVMGE